MFEWLSRMFTPPGTGAILAGAQQQSELARKAQQDAESSTSTAIDAAKEAAKGPLDSEAARRAQELRWKQLLGMQGSAWSFMGAGSSPSQGGVMSLANRPMGV